MLRFVFQKFFLSKEQGVEESRFNPNLFLEKIRLHSLSHPIEMFSCALLSAWTKNKPMDCRYLSRGRGFQSSVSESVSGNIKVVYYIKY